jgi:alpha-glucosidase
LTAVAGDVDRMKLAVTLLFTYAGVPCVYYGDEIGLEGGEDPDCRRCFEWDRARWHVPLHEHYRRLIQWRKQRVEWRHGAYQTLAIDEDAIAFARYVEGSVTLVAVNRGTAPSVLPLRLGELPVEVVRWRNADGDAVVMGDRLEVAARGQALLFGDDGRDD